MSLSDMCSELATPNMKANAGIARRRTELRRSEKRRSSLRERRRSRRTPKARSAPSGREQSNTAVRSRPAIRSLARRGRVQLRSRKRRKEVTTFMSSNPRNGNSMRPPLSWWPTGSQSSKSNFPTAPPTGDPRPADWLPRSSRSCTGAVAHGSAGMEQLTRSWNRSKMMV